MDNPETTDNIEHKIQNEDKQNKNTAQKTWIPPKKNGNETMCS